MSRAIKFCWSRELIEAEIREMRLVLDKNIEVVNTASADINALKVDWWNHLSREERLAQITSLEAQLASC